jgi:hypothetical protein
MGVLRPGALKFRDVADLVSCLNVLFNVSFMVLKSLERRLSRVPSRLVVTPHG